MIRLSRIVCFAAAGYFQFAGGFLGAQQVPAPVPGAELRYIAVLNRHGVRSPLWTAEQLNAYSVDPWPAWDVPIGYLTKQGFALMKLVGAFDREYLTSAGLVKPTGCEGADKFYFWSDISERDIETGRAIAAGMLPGCPVAMHSVPGAGPDPIFSPVAAGVGKTDPALAAAAILGRVGNNPQLLVNTYRAGFESMQRILLGCDAGKKCPPDGKSVKKLLMDEPGSVTPQNDRLALLNGPMSAASTIADTFLLEYTDGKKDQDVGWGRVNGLAVANLLLLQEAYNDLYLRTPYLARASASNLMSHMLRSMQQGVSGQAVEGAFGKPGDKGVFLLGHDSNISNVGGLMGISWLLEGYQPNTRPPGGALIFEVWKDTASGKHSVRTYFVSQSLDQMRKVTPLSLQSPPGFAPIFVPGCSTSAPGWPCDWDAFQRVVGSALDPAFVSQKLPAEGPLQ